MLEARRAIQYLVGFVHQNVRATCQSGHMAKTGRVYIVTNKPRGVLYVGVTSDLAKRVHQHKSGFGGFTSKYNLHRLVWYSDETSIEEAIAFEKRMKFWKRRWKIELVEEANPAWSEMSGDLL